MSDERARVGRRAFLALGAGTLLSGCVRSSIPGGREPTQQTTTQSESSRPPADGETNTGETNPTGTTATNRPASKPTTAKHDGVSIGIDSDKSEPQATATIGNGTKKQEPGEFTAGIEVWNNAETARRITVSVGEKGVSGEPVFRKAYRFEPDAYIDIAISEPGEYAVTVGIADRDSKTVDFEVTNCNDQSLFITVTENGTVQSNSISTLVKCTIVTITTENGNDTGG